MCVSAIALAARTSGLSGDRGGDGQTTQVPAHPPPLCSWVTLVFTSRRTTRILRNLAGSPTSTRPPGRRGWKPANRTTCVRAAALW